MEVIHFPGGAEATKKLEKDGLKKVPTANSHKEKLLIGPVQYTCYNCSTKTKITTDSMILKTVEFYCSECGTFHRVVNPCFSSANAVTGHSKKENKQS